MPARPPRARDGPRETMIDLHCHILPGIDDGAPDLEASVQMARVAVSEGIETVVATPHVSPDFDYDHQSIGRRTGELNIELARREIPLAVLPGAEVALSSLPALSDDDLRTVCLGEGEYLLVETPYTDAAAMLEEALFELQLRGLRPVLAHPERSPTFQADRGRLATLADRGVLCSVNAGSMAGQFGSTVRRLVIHLLRDGLVHNVSSDSHDASRRPPALTTGFEQADTHLPGIRAQRYWFTHAVPAAILSSDPVPPAPTPPRASASGWLRRAVGR